MATPSPDTVLAAHLEDNVEGLAVDANLFAGPELEIRSEVPDEAVFCTATGGPPPEPYLGIGEDFLRCLVQVVVRSEPNDYEGGLELAREVWEACHRASLTGYVFCLARESAPAPLGPDESGCFRWAINCELGWKG